jgi:hypothetical protein
MATMLRYIAAALLGSILLPLAGCEVNYTQPVVSQEPQTPQERNFETVWQGSIEMLREYGFASDPLRGGMQDRREGVIRTAPMVGRHWFEFWRKDYAGEFDLAENTLQTIYRQVTVRIKPASPNSTQYAATVEVQTFRSDKTPRWQPHDTSTIYSMFQVPGQAISQRQFVLNETTEPPGTVVVPLGRNTELEAKMSTDLAKFIAHQTAEGNGR